MQSTYDESTKSHFTNYTASTLNNGIRDCMIKHATEVEFIKYRYTTPVTVEFNSSQRSRDNAINIAAIHNKNLRRYKIPRLICKIN